MYKCEHCGLLFTEPKIVPEYRGEFWGMPAYEDVGVCPNCESDDVDWDYEEEGPACACCGDCKYGAEEMGCTDEELNEKWGWNDGFRCPKFEESLLSVVYQKGDL